MRRAALAVLLSLALARSAAAAEPSRIAVVQPAHPDAIVREAVTRLRAELSAAGFVVTSVEVEPGVDPRAAVEGAAAEARPFATVAIVRTDRGAAADVWIADHVTHKTLVRRVDTGATAEASVPAALAIRAVELLRASLLEAQAAPAPAPPSDVARWTASFAAPAPPPPPRALLERISLEVGFAALYGLGDTGGRLAPTFRFSYGAANGLAGRLTLIGPTATDQLVMLEAAYGFDRSWRTLVPYASLGAGAVHTRLEASGGHEIARFRTRAFAAVLGGSAGVAARAGERAAFLFDVHVLVAEPTAGAIVSGSPAAGRAEALVAAALGVVAGF
jgi:hypothetical protein